MKCRTCGQKAAVHMRQHRLALCPEHFLDWIPEQTQRFIKKYEMFTRRERVLVAVSGGKDSLSLWDILWRLGYTCDGLYIGLGIDQGMSYSDESRRLSEEFAQSRGLHLHVVEIQEQYGESIPMLSDRTKRGREKPCAVCGLSKRHIMNRWAHEKGYDVLVTGHNLDDEASVLLANTLHWASSFLVRQWPVLEAMAGIGGQAARIETQSQAPVPLLRAGYGSLCTAARYPIYIRGVSIHGRHKIPLLQVVA
jgi:tRNA(Ile)-lysidine synthase TilS/MesJ